MEKVKIIDLYIQLCNNDIEVFTSMISCLQKNLQYADTKLNALLTIKADLENQREEILEDVNG